MSVRVRYAPSPTGKQHIGGVRTALFNYFFARAQGGTFILRIEDTDQTRYDKDALANIYETFAWLGITWDEGPDKGGKFGPYFQSERKELYQKYTDELVKKDAAYYCYCTSERLENIRLEQDKAKKGETGYDRKCRNLSDAEQNALAEKGVSRVVRLKIPLEGETVFFDELLGEVKRANKDINPDPVLLKSDGFPTYHLANVVDDHFMEITHILRAQEWLPSVPLHVIMYNAFGWIPPKFCHLPMVMGSDGHKLSKRHGSTSMDEFREKGYLKEAVINYVSLLGWSYDDTRVFFSKEELGKLFTIKKLNKSPAEFDYKKLEWFNGQYIRLKSNDELKALVMPYLLKDGMVHDPLLPEEEKICDGMIPLIKERLKYLSDVSALTGFLFREIHLENKEMLIPKKSDSGKTIAALSAIKELLDEFESLSDEENEKRFRDKSTALGVKLGDFLYPLRIALTGTSISPPLFESIRVLGTKKTIERVDQAIKILKK